MESCREVTTTRNGRRLASIDLFGESVHFRADNDRLQERVESCSHEDYVIETLIEESKPEDTFWDVGGCLGIHTFTLAKHLDRGNVVCFEPMHTNRGVLIDNMRLNELSNVWVCPKALSDETGETTFSIRQSQQAGYGRHSLTEGEYDSVREVTVEQTRGDDVAQPAPNLVKIDVEGAEGLAIEGMMNTLRRDECRLVVLETHEPNPVQPSYEDFGYTEADLRVLLEEAGFTVEVLEKEYHWVARK